MNTLSPTWCALREFAQDWLIKESGKTSRFDIDGLYEYYKNFSVAALVSLLDVELKDELFQDYSEQDWRAIEYDWHFWARPKQIAPSGNWFIWLVLAGRGFGKTRCGAEWLINGVKEQPKSRVGLIAETVPDARDVMVLGEAGILACSPPWFTPKYTPSKRLLEWPNGSVGKTFTGQKPDMLRGPSHHFVWLDEPAKYQYPDDVWDNMELGLRLGTNPRCCATTTPKPISLIKDLMADEDCVTTVGTTFENMYNLSDRFIQRIVQRYKGTRLGLQELYAYVLEDDPNALWSRDILDDTRYNDNVDKLKFVRIIIGVDPPGGVTECGIVVAGLTEDLNCYILEDRSRYGKPHEWAEEVVQAYYDWEADLIVAERNFGGDMVESTVRSVHVEEGSIYKPVGDTIPIKLVHASKGKYARAEPISALCHKGWIHHVGTFGDLEDEQCTWVKGETKESPNRLDAMVWAVTELMLEGEELGHAEWYQYNPFYGDGESNVKDVNLERVLVPRR